MKALLLAAGLGTRLLPLTGKTPKPLLPIKGRPLLEIHLDRLRAAGVREVLINTHYLHEMFVEFTLTYMCEHPDMFITLAHEPMLLGSAGTLVKNHEFFRGTEDFLVIYADNLTDIDYREFMARHTTTLADVTIAAQIVASEDVHKKGIIELDSSGRVSHFIEKPKAVETSSRLANGGIYCLSHRAFDFLEPNVLGEIYDFGHDFFPGALDQGAFLNVYQMTEHLLDIGTPESYAAAQKVDWIGRKVCFLDRDGVINLKAPEHEYITKVEDFVLVPGVVNALVLLRTLGYEFVVVTNQRGVARGLMSQEDLDEIHRYMREQLARYNIGILDIFACTHEEDSCDCRKPKDGLLRQACAKYDIDLAASVLISDSCADTRMAAAFGVGSWIYTESGGFMPTFTSKK